METELGLLGRPGTVEELAGAVTLSVDSSLLAIGVLTAVSWSVKRTSMLFHFQYASAFSELQRLAFAWRKTEEHGVFLEHSGEKLFVLGPGFFHAVQLDGGLVGCFLIKARKA